MNMQTCTKSNPRETEGTKTLLFINIQSYNERSDGSYVYRKTKQISLPFFRSCFLDTLKKGRVHLPLVTSGYYQDGRSLISSFSRSSKMAAMSNSRPWATLKCQNPYPGGGTLSQFPVGSPPPPPWGLTLIGALVNRSRSNKLDNLSRCLLHWEVVDTELLNWPWKRAKLPLKVK